MGSYDCVRRMIVLFLVSLSFSSPFRTSLLPWISAQYKWRWHGFLPPPDHSQVDVEFPRAPDPLKGYCTVSIGSESFEFVRVRTRHARLMLPSLISCTVMQPRRSAPDERDNVTAAHDPGRVTAILYSRLATSLRSLAIILPIHLHILSLASTFATIFL